MPRSATSIHVAPRRRAASLAAAIAGVSLVYLAWPVGVSLAADSEVCPVQANQSPLPGAPSQQKIRLDATRPTQVLNFGSDRGTKVVDVAIHASRAFPPDVDPRQFELVVPERFRRVSETLQSTSLHLPSFTRPRLIEARTTLRFDVCVDSKDADAGTYSGQVIVVGPGGIGKAVVPITVNIRQGWIVFALELLGALAVAALLLVYRAAKEERAKSADPKGWLQATKAAADLGFVVQTLGSLVVAAGVTIAAYRAAPAWGEDGWASFFTLCGAAFGAAGLGNLVATFRGK